MAAEIECRQENMIPGSPDFLLRFCIAYVSSRKMDLNEKATVRFETMPGKQGQMDWGFFEDHLVYEDGKWKKLYCFLMILGYSRMRYIEFVTDMSTNTLIRCHQNAFRYFGGYPYL
jgi:transposase